MTLTVKQLAAALRSHDLPVTGLKKELARRLAERDQQEESPTDLQLKLIRDLERKLNWTATYDIFQSKQRASAWINDAFTEKKSRQNARK